MSNKSCKYRYLHSWLALVLLLLMVSALLPARLSAGEHARVVVVISNYMSLDDVLDAGPNMQSLVSESALGLMNTGLRRHAAIRVRYSALGAGTYLRGFVDSVQFCDADETVAGQKAGDISRFETGLSPKAGNVVCLSFSRLLHSQGGSTAGRAGVGAVGENFHAAGLHTAVLGNTDTPDRLMRLAPLVAMDRQGIVDAGRVGLSAIEKDPLSPSGCRDSRELASMAKRLMADHSLLVVELGDLSRLEAAKEDLLEAAYPHYRSQALADLDRFIGELRPEVDRLGAALIICSPCRAARKNGPFSNLSPVLIYREGGTPGLLSSSSTRATGLISNIDMAATIIDSAGLPVPEKMLGRPAEITPAADAAGTLRKIEAVAARNYHLQIPLLGSVAVVVLLVATLSELYIRNPRSRRSGMLLSFLLLILVSIPPAMLLVDSLGSGNVVSHIGRFIAVVLILSIGFTAVSRLISRAGRGLKFSPLTVALMVTSLVIVADVLTGSRLLSWSIVSCDHITGIRYYGLGNEYMGVLIGTALLWPVLLMRRRTDTPAKDGKQESRINGIWLVPLFVWFAIVSVVIGYPSLGANVGGLIAAVATFGVGLVASLNMKFTMRHFLLLAGVLVAAVVLFALVDSLAAGGRGTHLGRLTNFVHIYGWGYLFVVIGRKLSMHLGILGMPQTYLPLIGSIPFFLMYSRRTNAEQETHEDSQALRKVGVVAIIVGMVVAFLFNDSGIVPAALMVAYLAVSMLYTRIREIAQ